MKKDKLFLIIFLASLIITACSTGKSAFRKGNYYDATLKAVNNLRTNPDSKTSLEIVKKSYPMAFDYFKRQVDQLYQSNNIDKYLQIVETYSKLNKLADEITRCPAALEVLKPVVYFDKQLNKAEDLAIEEQFNNAVGLLNSGFYIDAREALKRLNWVKEKAPGTPGLDEKIAIAYKQSIFKTVVELKPELNSNYQINSLVYYNRLFNFLSNKSEKNFTKFYTPIEAEEKEIVPHEIVTLQFVNFHIGELVYREKEQEYESDSISVGTFTNANGEEFEAFGTVKATANTFERELFATVILEVQIIDYVTGELIKTRRFPSEYLWKNYWANYNGDKRALPKDVLEMTKEKQKIPPSPQEMFLILSDPLFTNASAYLQSYYRNK